MGMCKKCGKVFPVQEMNNGLCKTCDTPENRVDIFESTQYKDRFILKNDKNDTKSPPLGFSWTILFFGFWVPVVRSDWINFSWIFIVNIFAVALSKIPNIFGLILPFVVMLPVALTYNKIYIRKLLKNGYYPANRHSEKVLESLGAIKNMSEKFKNTQENSQNNQLTFLKENEIESFTLLSIDSSDGITAFAFCQQKNMIALGIGYNKEIQILSYPELTIISKISTSGMVSTIKFTKDNQYLCWGSSDDFTYIYNLSKKEIVDKRDLAIWTKGVEDIDISHNGKYIISVGLDGLTLNHFLGMFISDLYNYTIYCVKFSPKMQNIALLGSKKGYIYIYDLNNPINQKQQVLSFNQKFPMDFYDTGHSNSILCIEHSNNGEIFIVGSSNGEITLFNFLTKNIIKQFNTDGEVTSLKFMDDEDYFISTSSLGLMQIWSIKDEKIILNINEHNSSIVNIFFYKNNILSADIKGNLKKINITMDDKVYSNISQNIHVQKNDSKEKNENSLFFINNKELVATALYIEDKVVNNFQNKVVADIKINGINENTISCVIKDVDNNSILFEVPLLKKEGDSLYLSKNRSYQVEILQNGVKFQYDGHSAFSYNIDNIAVPKMTIIFEWKIVN